MRLFLLLSSLGWLSLTACETSCGPEEECLEALLCPYYNVERQKLDSMSRNTASWTEQLAKLKQLVCNGKERKVCCERNTTTTTNSFRDPRDAPNYRPSLEEAECGELNSHAGFILGGNDTKLGEYPYLSLLGRKRSGGQGAFWHCGGTLINRWYVLSAAHCGPRVDLVRLGEWEVVDPDSFTRNHSSIRGCVYYSELSFEKCKKGCPVADRCRQGNYTFDCNDRICATPHQDIEVAEVKIHPDYGKTEIGLAINDIMLLKLSKPVEYNDYARPICLPSQLLGKYGEPDSRVFDNNRPTVVGWGRTMTEEDDKISVVSTAKQQFIMLPAVSNVQCLNKYQSLFSTNLTGNILPGQHLCAGGEPGRDSCKGDSGGPLMARVDDISPWQIVGVVSGGTKRCGIGAPGIFTRVTHYDQWIRDNMV